MRQKYIIYTNIDKIMKIKMIKGIQIQLIFDSKKCYQVCYIQVIMYKNIKNIVELVVKVEKSNCNRLHRLPRDLKAHYLIKSPMEWYPQLTVIFSGYSKLAGEVCEKHVLDLYQFTSVN